MKPFTISLSNQFKKPSLSILICILFLFILAIPTAYPQSKATIQNIDFEIVGDQMIITYDITNAQPGESFTIALVVSTVSGKKIPANTLSGDVHKNISGGKGKRIFWDLRKDNITLDDQILIEVIATPDKKPATAAQPKPIAPIPGEKSYTTGSVLLRSVIWPGLGNQKISGGGAWWTLGVLGYGSLASSWLLNISASSAYDDYLAATTAADRDSFYNTASLSNSLSKTAGYLAIGIWVVDFTITAIRAGSHKGSGQAQSYRFDLNYSYNTDFQQPMFTMRYRF